MRRLACAALFLLASPIALAQHFHHGAVTGPGRGSPCKKEFAQAEPVPTPERYVLHWPVTTTSADAQMYFDQGMTEYYGFDYEEAMRNFRRAKALDRDMAMASWGIALAAGPNINLGMDAGCREVAMDESARAVELTSRAEQKGDAVTLVERGLIYALALRYSGPLTETVAYAVAMRQLWLETTKNTKKGADVANVGALYAEGLLEMRPWGLFNAAYEPALDTPAILDVLRVAKDAEDYALGANHFWIHAIEASAHPRDGMASAELLTDRTETKEHTPDPNAPGHLVHMPSHIYLLAGDYERARQSNDDAVHADRHQYGVACGGTFEQYKANPKCPQLYYGHYLSHNLFFRSVAAAFSGQSERAVSSACETREHAQRFVANEPGLQRYMTAPYMALVMNRNWDAINDSPQPPAECYMCPFEANGCHILTAMWAWARGMAAAAKGNYEEAGKKYTMLSAEMALIMPPGPTGWGNNSAAAVLAIAQSTLQARFTWGGGQCRPDKCRLVLTPELCGECNAVSCLNTDVGCAASFQQAVEHLKLAVTHEDALVYDEPPQWFPPTREALGGAYLQIARLGGANRREMLDLAQTTFEMELARHPASGRALFGKMRALEGKGAGFEGDAYGARKDFCSAWRYADYKMTVDELWPSVSAHPTPEPEVICPQQPLPAGEPSQRRCAKEPAPEECKKK